MIHAAIQALHNTAEHCEVMSGATTGGGASVYDRLASALRTDAGALAEINAAGEDDDIRSRIELADSFLFT